MGYYMCCGLFIWVSLFNLVNSYEGPTGMMVTVGIFTQCGDGTGYNKLVPGDKEMTVLINGSSFYPDDSLSCTVVFKAEDPDEHLYYKVKSYTMYSQGSEIKIETKSNGTYRELESFTLRSSPKYGINKKVGRYLRITVTRGSLNNEHFYMSLHLYTDEQHNIVKTVGTIIGIVAAIIAVIVIIIILCVCCICRAGKRRSHKGVVVTTDTRNAHINIPEIGTPRAYPFGPPPGNFAIHPGYPTAYPPTAYPPTAYPPTAYPPQPYGQPPPPYTDIAPKKPSDLSY